MHYIYQVANNYIQCKDPDISLKLFLVLSTLTWTYGYVEGNVDTLYKHCIWNKTVAIILISKHKNCFGPKIGILLKCRNEFYLNFSSIKYNMQV